MSALATDADLRNLDNVDHVDHRRACRPFGKNCGFTLAESSQYIILMDDELALDLGAQIFGSVPGVFVNADGDLVHEPVNQSPHFRRRTTKHTRQRVVR